MSATPAAGAVVLALFLPLTFGLLLPSAIASADPYSRSLSPLGLLVALPGMALTATCIQQFYHQGHGTLAPWQPPQRLVTTGCYRYCRNPMYWGVLIMVSGIALGSLSPATALYTLLLGLGFHCRVRLYEEPALDQRFGERWRVYCRQTPRWIPSRRRTTETR